MRRTIAIAIFTLLVTALFWCAIGNRLASRIGAPEQAGVSAPAIDTDRPTPVPAMAASPGHLGTTSFEAQPVESHEAPRIAQRAFRFVLRDSRLELEAAEDVHGDFHIRRGPLAWQPGMLCCRLLDSEQRVLAEETVQAPDRVCVVLDPNTTGPDGKPSPAVLSPKGPAVFQVRMPRIDSATQMKVYRITGPRPAAAGGEPAGQLLATVPLLR